METGAFYIIGFPDDTWDSISETFDFACELGTRSAKFSIFTPNLVNDEYEELLNPDIFIPFENTLSINPCKNLSREELSFLYNQLTILYDSKINSMKAL